MLNFELGFASQCHLKFILWKQNINQITKSVDCASFEAKPDSFTQLGFINDDLMILINLRNTRCTLKLLAAPMW